VATSVGGIPEIVEDGVGGILVPPKDSAAVAEGLLTLLRDEGRRRTMGDAARERVRERFDMVAIAASIQDRYMAMLAASDSAGRGG